MKLIIYIAMIAAIFLFVQDRFDIFDVSWKDEIVKEKTDSTEIKEEDIKEGEYVEIELPSGLLVRVDVEIANSDAQRSRGLSGRKYLGDYEGMLFIFNSEVNNPFWMKDVLIPLDILFIDSQSNIVDIKENQNPCTTSSCPLVYSNQQFMYVLEVNGGFCSENNVEVGYSVVQYLQ
ncbi:MAG: DUF192 domain-containing protein [Candidatus Dojkabacteria bacterium]|nr:DUF192 domain-containing protein [Candidatus Dojkabacteria bacterium]